MNNKQILELTHHLSQALDQNYDVVNMEIVLAVISNLEGATITKEQLETTRLAKYINQLRRRTNNENLARRSKSLLKKWREMVGMQQTAGGVGGDSQQQQLTATTTTSPTISATTVSLNNNNNNSQSHSHSHDNASTHQRRQNSQPTPTSPLAPNSAEQIIDTRVDYLRTGTGMMNCSPTSFSNLISNLSSNNNNNNNMLLQQRVMSGSGSGSGDYNNSKSFNVVGGLKTKPTHMQQQQQQQQTKRTETTFVIDHSSNSNSISNFGSQLFAQNRTKMFAVEEMPPIVIDIDSDSQESENARLQQQQQQNATKIVAATTTTTTMPPAIIQTVSAGTKLKKSKKDKKRKERWGGGSGSGVGVGDIQNKVSTTFNNDERSSSNTTTTTTTTTIQKHKQNDKITLDSANDIFIVNAKENKQHTNASTNMSSMSEILSLSNSSMSSLFPSESTLTSLKNNNKNAAASSVVGIDLTFAGKFKPSQQQQTNNNNTINSTTTTTINGGGIESLELSGGGGGGCDSSSQNAKASRQQQQTTSKGYHVDDSTSSSSQQHFPFEVIDVVSQDNNQMKMSEELRLQSGGGSGLETITTTTTTTLADGMPSNTTKLPKKRGRKKGSKGVDSIIAQETSLSQQIFGSGNKKVKTTKELFNEIQNRKLGNFGVASSCGSTQAAAVTKPTASGVRQPLAATNQKLLNSRPASSCSEPSLHSPRTMDAYITNTTTISTGGATRSSTDNVSNPVEDGLESESDTMTSEHSRENDGGNKGRQQNKLKRTTSLDSNSNSLQFGPNNMAAATMKRSNRNPLAAGEGMNVEDSGVEAQLRELLMQLPVPEQPEFVEEQYTRQLVPCTCVLIEELPKEEEVTDEMANDEHVEQHKAIVGGGGGGESGSDMLTMGVKNVENQKLLLPHGDGDGTKSNVQEFVVQKPKKSIFDLDFDEDDDPLQSLLAEATTTTVAAAVAPIKVEAIEDVGNGNFKVGEPLTEQEGDGGMHMSVEVENGEELLLLPPLPLYRVEEDPACMARQRYEFQTNQITKFHIDALHNRFIPNVNGNWDDGTIAVGEHNTTQHSYDVTNGEDVVPQYGCLINERIPKDLSHLKFFSCLRPKKTEFQNMPFLGVAKCLPACRRQKRKLRKWKREESQPKALQINVGILDQQQQQQQQNDNGIPTIRKLLKELKPKEEWESEQAEENVHDEDVPMTTVADDGLMLALDMLPNNNVAKQMSSRRSSSSESSSSSNTSLQKTQDSINEKLRRHHQARLKNCQEGGNVSGSDGENYQLQVDDYNNLSKRKRKKRKKFMENGSSKALHVAIDEHTHMKQKKIKRIRIAINGNIATQRQISVLSSSNNNTSDDDDDDNDHSTCDDYDEHSDDDVDDEDKISYKNNESDGVDRIASGGRVDGGSNDPCDSDIENESVESIIMPDDGENAAAAAANDHYHVPMCVADEYAIVQRPLDDSSSNNNHHHIVLTIKKTPSKMNSPANSLTSAISPSVNGVSMTTTTTMPFEAEAVGNKPTTIADGSDKMTETSLAKRSHVLKPNIKQRVRRRRRKRPLMPRIDLQLRNLFPAETTKTTKAGDVVPMRKKTHRKIFFPDELLVYNNEGRRECIFNCNSCNSSCAEEESDYEYYASTEEEEAAPHHTNGGKETTAGAGASNSVNRSGISLEPQSSSSSSSSSEDTETETDECESGESKNVVKHEDGDVDELKLENNGLLTSFNTVFLTASCPTNAAPVKNKVVVDVDVKGDVDVEVLQQSNSLPNKNNCDDLNNLYNNNNNNNLNVIKYNLVNNTYFNKNNNNNNNNYSDGDPGDEANNKLTSSSTLDRTEAVTHSEYQTGIRTIAENDGDHHDENDSSSSTRVQQFKEWHQVLQLRSYNNELLTVLPYVLLE